MLDNKYKYWYNNYTLTIRAFAINQRDIVFVKESQMEIL